MRSGVGVGLQGSGATGQRSSRSGRWVAGLLGRVRLGHGSGRDAIACWGSASGRVKCDRVSPVGSGWVGSDCDSGDLVLWECHRSPCVSSTATIKVVDVYFISMAGRKKLDRTNMHARVAPDTPDRLKEIAHKLGYTYAGEGSTGQLLDAIANGELILIATQTNDKSG